MPPPVATLEIDIRRASPEAVLQKVEQTTGLRFALRRARVTAKRSHWVFESIPPSAGQAAC